MFRFTKLLLWYKIGVVRSTLIPNSYIYCLNVFFRFIERKKTKMSQVCSNILIHCRKSYCGHTELGTAAGSI